MSNVTNIVKGRNLYTKGPADKAGFTEELFQSYGQLDVAN